MKYNKKTIIAVTLLSFLLIFASLSFAAEAQKHNYKPTAGYIPDEETAIKIAIAVWIPIYGKEQIEKEKPYEAILKNGIWYVTGSLPDNWFGGIAEAEINQESGCIMRISHGQ